MKYYDTIEMHFYFGKDYFPVKRQSLEEILDLMAERKIKYNVMMSYMSLFGDFEKGNEELFTAIEKYDNLLGYCYINGHYMKESIKQMEMYLPLKQCGGVKFHPEYSAKRPDDDSLLPLFQELAHKYGKPINIHSWPFGEHGNPRPFSHPSCHAALAAKIPELNIIMGHMGGPEWAEAIKIAAPFPNLYLDTGSSYTHYDKVKAAVDVIGADRLLFGSGCSFDAQLGSIYDSEITEEEKRQVLYGTAAKLFNIE